MTAPTTEQRTYNLGPVLPHVRRAAELVGNRFGITTILGWRLSARDKAGHPAGLALDYMCSPAQGDQITAYLQANHAELGLDYLIWKQRSWDPDTGWTEMEDRGSPTQNHLDHVHAQFKAVTSALFAGASTSSSAGIEAGFWDAGVFKWLPGGGLYATARENPQALDELGPSAWLDGAAGVGLKLLAGGAAAALIVVGAIRTVSPGGTSS